MLFTEFRFFGFFAAVFLIYWVLPGNRSRKAFLLLSSYVFYGAWDYRFLALIFISTITDFIVGQKIEAAEDRTTKRQWLYLSLTANLGLLGIFKYFNFFADSFVGFANIVGLPADPVTLKIILPVGISFYTFQTLSYTIDIYRGRIKATTSLLDFSFFVAFFPQLVAGPIVRARDFLPQLGKKALLSRIDYRWALTLFLVGFFKKAVIADNLAIFVDAFYRNPEAYTAYQSWLALVSYQAQIFCDFSGYSDMAIALAGLLGYRLRSNFNMPYLTADITAFWKHWHMSLSSWLRDYVFVSLERANKSRNAGRRSGNWISYRNLMYTFLIAGLWHGAAWTFVIWGATQGLALMAHRYWRERFEGNLNVSDLFAVPMTQAYICITLILFRSDSLATSEKVFLQLFNFDAAHVVDAYAPNVLFLTIALAVMWCLHYLRHQATFVPFWRNSPAPVFSLAYGAFFAVAIALRAINYQPFIYFQF